MSKVTNERQSELRERAEAGALLFESNEIAVKQNAELPFVVRRVVWFCQFNYSFF